MNRRASLPGADELFGTSTGWNQRGERPPPPDAGDEVDARMLAGMRRLTAPEDEIQSAARSAAGDAVDVPSPDVGSLLRWAAELVDAHTVVEVGSAAGVSGLWILGGLPQRGVLTSIEADPEVHGLATDAFRAARATERVRSIQDDPRTVLPRLSDHAYDLVLLQSDPVDYPEELEHVRRLLRPGGMLVARGILRPGEHPDELAQFVQELVEGTDFGSVVLPVDGGVAIATHRAEDLTER